MSHDIVVATHIGGQLVYVVHTSITTARRRISYLTGQIFKLTHPVDHSIFSGYEFEKLENMDNIYEGFNDEDIIDIDNKDIIIDAQIKRFKDIFEDQSISLEIAANKATQIMYANNDPILIDTAK